MESDKLILDACCGSRMFWFDKHNPLVLFVDKRSETLTAKDKDRIRTIDVKPDVIADFTNLPFEDNSFYMVVFDPPQSVVQRWLRETKNLHICVYNCACGYGYEISKADNGTHIASSTYKGTNDGGEWDTYEEALEAGIQEALKLI